jgi:hypothetical protein
MVASSNTELTNAKLASRVSIVTEFDTVTQSRLDFIGGAVLTMTDEVAGRWFKELIVETIRLAEIDDRVTI